MTDSRKLACSGCGTILETGSAAAGSSEARKDPCPSCGSTFRTVRLTFSDDISARVRDRLEAKVKDRSFPSRKRVRKEMIQGFDPRVSKGDYVYKERVIDRDANTYREHVTEESGAVVHSVSESLTDHFGHGSAKFDKPPSRDRG